MRKKPVNTRANRPLNPIPLPAAVAPPPAFTIVGIGASAGGFEAFIQLLEGFGPNPHLAIILVQQPQFAMTSVYRAAGRLLRVTPQ